MTREDVINGTIMSLLARQGLIDSERVIDSIKELSGMHEVDVNLINSESSRGILYISQDGELLNDADEEAERVAAAKVVPIGYYEKQTYYPLCALLIKDGKGWNGADIGNCQEIYRIAASKLRFGIATDSAVKAYKSLRGYIDIRGKGWEEIKRYNDNLGQRIRDIELDLSTDGEFIKQYDSIHPTKVEPIIKEISQNADSGTAPKAPNNSVQSTIWHDIYDRLLIKSDWNSKNFGGLTDYIKHIYKKVATEISACQNKPRGNGYMISSNMKSICFNSGLLDMYGNDLLLVCPLNESASKLCKSIKIVESKVDLISFGFSKTDINNPPKPVKFYKDKSELIFDGTLADFDLDSLSRLNHIVNERKFRLPKQYSSMAQEAIAQMLKNSIIQGLRIAARDYRYFVPMYNFERAQIQFLAPIYLDGRLTGVPDIVAIIGQTNGFYTLNTIITVEDAKNNARLITIPGGIWLDS